MTQQLHRPEPMNRRRWALPTALAMGAAIGTAAAVAVTDAMAHDGGTPPPAEMSPVPPASSSGPSAVPAPDAGDRTLADPIQLPLVPSSSAPPSSLAPPDGVVPPTSPERRPAYLIIQDEIDRALSEREQDTRDG